MYGFLLSAQIEQNAVKLHCETDNDPKHTARKPKSFRRQGQSPDCSSIGHAFQLLNTERPTNKQQLHPARAAQERKHSIW